jgi:uncharacterized protein (DUF39 family)
MGVALRSYQEINEKIKKGKVVVVTAEEVIELVDKKGIEKTAREVDVVTTGTFGAMCSSGAMINTGHTKPRMKISEAYLNGVMAYGGLAAVDLYIGATQVAKDDPLNKIYPGEFKYGGGYVTAIIRGDVAAVRAALDAGQSASEKVGEVISVHIIPRPHANVDEVLPLGRGQAKSSKK